MSAKIPATTPAPQATQTEDFWEEILPPPPPVALRDFINQHSPFWTTSQQEARDNLARILLVDNIRTLEKIVAKKIGSERGSATVQRIRKDARPDGKQLHTLTETLSLLMLELEPQKRGRKPITRQPKKPGRPRKWTPDDYASLVRAHKVGVGLLTQQGKRVTNEAAFQAFILDSEKQRPPSERSSRATRDQKAKQCARRLPDAKRFLRSGK